MGAGALTGAAFFAVAMQISKPDDSRRALIKPTAGVGSRDESLFVERAEPLDRSPGENAGEKAPQMVNAEATSNSWLRTEAMLDFSCPE